MSSQNQNNNHTIDRISAILSLNGALIGEVFPQLRAAKIQWDNKTISLFFYYDEEITDDDRESLECAATEVIAEFPNHALEVNIIRCDYPERVPQSSATNIALVYRRKEAKPPWAEPPPWAKT